jgi:hypothetical protein
LATANASGDAKTSVSCSMVTTVQSSVHITLVVVFTSAILPLLALGNWGRLASALCLPFKVVQMVYSSLHGRDYSQPCEGRGHTFQMRYPLMGYKVSISTFWIESIASIIFTNFYTSLTGFA